MAHPPRKLAASLDRRLLYSQVVWNWRLLPPKLGRALPAWPHFQCSDSSETPNFCPKPKGKLFPFSLITTSVFSLWCAGCLLIAHLPDAFFWVKWLWESGHLHLIWGLLILILKPFSDKTHFSPSLQTAQLPHTITLMATGSFSLCQTSVSLAVV